MAKPDVPAELQALAEFLETDSRPTAILDAIHEASGNALGHSVVYQNSAFRRLELGPSSLDEILKQAATDLNVGKASRECPTAVVRGKIWTVNLVAQQWQILACRGRSQDTGDGDGDSTPYASDTQDSGIALDKSSSSSNAVSEAENSINWTRFRIAGLSPWIEFVRTFDWSSTPLGPLDDWPESLRGYVLHIMSNPNPRVICWGSTMTIIYNEACIPLFGERYRECLGGSAPDMWADYWHEIGPLLESTLQGNTTRHENMHLTMRRKGYLEDTYWNTISLPISGIHGDIIGLFLEFTETSKLVIGQRRRDTMVEMSKNIGAAETMHTLFDSYMKTLEGALTDVPFALLYQVNQYSSGSESDSSDSSSRPVTCVLHSATGVPERDTGICKTFRLDGDDDDNSHELVKACRKAWDSGSPVTFSREDCDFSKFLPTGVSDHTIEDEIRTLMVAPIISLGAGDALGILVTAMNPRCPMDDEYKLWMNILADVLTRASTLISLPREQRRAQKIADDMNNALASQLRLVTAQADRMEAKFSRMAAEAPTGMFVHDREGRPLYVNEAYLRVLGLTKEEQAARSSVSMAWSEHIHPDDSVRFEAAWRGVLEHKTPLTLEYRLKKPWVSVDQASGQEVEGERWILANAFPDVDSDGKITSIQGWLTDISHRKFSEKLLAQKLEDALENKRRTENFIDTTSHEMRNPLSAIVQSADSIVSLLDIPGESIALTREGVDEIIDAAETINLCAQHQKRIVDDILTLSKLDASLLHLSPDKVQVPALLAKALKMYEAEIVRAGITAAVRVEPTYDLLNVDWVILDPSRLLQVIINLLTNAIKFTQYAEKRRITMYLGASHKAPTGAHHNVSFIPAKHPKQMNSPLPEFGHGEELYLQMAVEDTGSGLNEEEMKMLFQRFHQANAQTYSKYGGSGLGLFISRELCELQGGQIGVSSGNGRTLFTFFVRAKRWVPDASPAKTMLPLRPRYISTSASPVIFKRSGSFTPDGPPSAPLSRVGSIVEESQASAGDRRASAGDQRRDLTVAVTAPQQLHVLIVEDSILNQKVASKQLQKAGCIVHVANHGLECLNFLEKTTFYSGATPLSIILLDLQMPTMDGLTCIKLIRERQDSGEINAYIPVIAVTANARPEQVSTALDAGMDQVVTKPFRISELMPQMHALVAEITERDPSG